MKLRNFVCLVMMCAVLFVITACGADDSQEINAASMPNPFTTYGTLDEAADSVDFSIILPDKPAWATEVLYRVSNTDLLEIIYNGDGMQYRIRKAAGDQDISGDYNIYSELTDVTFQDVNLAVKGDDGKVALVTWLNGGYSYSVSFSDQISLDEAEAFISVIE